MNRWILVENRSLLIDKDNNGFCGESLVTLILTKKVNLKDLWISLDNFIDLFNLKKSNRIILEEHEPDMFAVNNSIYLEDFCSEIFRLITSCNETKLINTLLNKYSGEININLRFHRWRESESLCYYIENFMIDLFSQLDNLDTGIEDSSVNDFKYCTVYHKLDLSSYSGLEDINNRLMSVIDNFIIVRNIGECFDYITNFKGYSLPIQYYNCKPIDSYFKDIDKFVNKYIDMNLGRARFDYDKIFKFLKSIFTLYLETVSIKYFSESEVKDFAEVLYSDLLLNQLRYFKMSDLSISRQLTELESSQLNNKQLVIERIIFYISNFSKEGVE